MELELIRKYHPEGTNGRIQVGQFIICHTIELPWKMNMRNISCIPEGYYALKKRYSKKRGWHLILLGVEGRSYILLHAANNAQQELRGCIAPVSKLTGQGKGEQSRRALELLEFVVFSAFEMGEEVRLCITS